MGLPTILAGRPTRNYHKLLAEEKPVLGQYRVLVYPAPGGGVGYGYVTSVNRDRDLDPFSRKPGPAIYAIKVRPK